MVRCQLGPRDCRAATWPALVGPWVAVTHTNPQRGRHSPPSPAPAIGGVRDAGPAAESAVDSPLDLPEPAAAGAVDGDPPVPITLWRLADIDHPFRHDRTGGLTPRTAGLLVGTYTRPGDTLLSLGDDPAIAGAAGGGGRTYLCVQESAELVGLDRLAGAVRLIVLRRPQPGRPVQWWTRTEQLRDMFAACRRLLTPDGYIIVTSTVIAGQSGAADHGHSERVIPAAHDGGLGWWQHIIAVTAPIVGERVTWLAAPADAATIRAATDISIHLDLLVFVARGRAEHG